MSKKNKITKPAPISGFPEWTPDVRLVELQWLDHIRKTFESYGYCSIETPAVERLEIITAKGEDVDKEIYVLDRLQADPDEEREAKLALHFDQTVPFARYSAQHFNELTFPFKRYQIQKVWRGERPQLGRCREFYQCDIDVINVDTLPLHFDAEMPAIIYEAMSGLGLGKFQIRISNRKILLGLLDSLGLSEQAVGVTRIIDKLDKIGADGVNELLLNECGLSEEVIDKILSVVSTKDLSTLTPANDAMREGIEELSFVMKQLEHLPEDAVVADLSIVRGLDYYTGTVYETRLLEIPEFTSSVCSGGRYDDLASNYINKKLPGVGISIGFTRLFEVLHHYGYIKSERSSPADILMVMPNEDRRTISLETASILRKRGFNVENFHGGKLKRQLAYAEKKGIPYVWFPPFEDGSPHEIKNMSTGEQQEAHPHSWSSE